MPPAKSNSTCDVFIVCSSADLELAARISAACEANGLLAFNSADLEAGDNWGDAIWEALSESRAVIAILSKAGLTSYMAVELGGARAWNKPVYAVATASFAGPPIAALTGVPLYPEARINEIIREIRLSGDPFSDEERAVLSKLYADSKVSVDQLALSSKSLEGMVHRFGRSTKKRVTGERLLSELLRMRKQNKLPRISDDATREPARRSKS